MRKTYSHTFVSFMMFLAAVKSNRLQKGLPEPDSSYSKIAIVPSHVISSKGVWYDIGKDGKYVKHFGECPVDFGKFKRFSARNLYEAYSGQTWKF